MPFFPLTLFYTPSNYSEQLHTIQTKLTSLENTHEEIHHTRPSLYSLYLKYYLFFEVIVVPLCVFYIRVFCGKYIDSTLHQFQIETESPFSRIYLIIYAALTVLCLGILNALWLFVIRRVINYYYSLVEKKSKNHAAQLIVKQRKVLNEMMARYRYEYVNELVRRYGKSLRFYEQHFNGDKDASTQTSPEEEKKYIFDWVKERHLVLKSRVELNSVAVDTSGIGAQRRQRSENAAHAESEELSAGTLQDSDVYTEKEEQLMRYIHTQRHQMEQMRVHIRELRDHMRAAGMTAKSLSPQKLFPHQGSSTHQKQSSLDSNNGEALAAAAPESAQPESESNRLEKFTMGKKKSSWFDRMLNKVIGNDAEHCVALICEECHTHNGLQLLEDAREPAIFKCYECGHLNHTNNSRSSAAVEQPDDLQDEDNAALQENTQHASVGTEAMTAAT